MDRLRVTDLTEQLTGRDGVEAARRAAPKLSPEQPAPVKAPPSVYALALRALEQYAEHETPGGDPGVSETASSDQESLNDEAYSVH